MSKLTRKTNRKLAKKERGQVLVLVALAIVGIVAMIGLTLDVGMMFIEDARLRRAVDAAALGAALQLRQGIPTYQLRNAATEFLLVNGVTIDSDHPVTVDTCVSEPSMCYDATQGINIPRKLVRVRATATVNLAFLPVIGINKVNIAAEATGESASLDLVLAIDTSESMTTDGNKMDPISGLYPYESLLDPTVCNDDQKSSDAIDSDGNLPAGVKANLIADIGADGIPGECHPFEEVKIAAKNFVDKLFFPYDRVTVVTFSKTATNLLDFAHNCDLVAHPSGCTDIEIKNTITDVIKNLTVYDADGNVCPNGQPCLSYCTQAIINAGFCGWSHPENWLNPTDPGAVYAGGFDCGIDTSGNYFYMGVSDPSQCTTTNLGGGLRESGSAFGVAQRQASLFVVILLTDGAANSGTLTDGTPTCPPNTWDIYRDVPVSPSAPLCRDSSSETRHCIPGPTLATCVNNGNGLPAPFFQNGMNAELDYDADDSAHDWADYVGIYEKAVIYAIGLGDQVHKQDDAGGKLLKYASQYVGNGQYYDASAADIGLIFKQIGDKIATRLAH